MESNLVMNTPQAPLAGTSHFLSSIIHFPFWPSLPFLHDSTPSSDSPQQQTSGSDLYYDRSFPDSGLSTTLSSPQLSCSNVSHRGSYSSNPTTSLSLHIRDNTDEDGDLAFPSYEASGLPAQPVQMSLSSPKQDDHPAQLSSPVIENATYLYKTTQDDQAILPKPTYHIDYLSHEWNEEDIWLSWSFLLHSRGTLAHYVRLENALWRSWMKTKNHLKTMAPENLNWFKDYDVTWLYGPHQTEGKKVQLMSDTPPPLRYKSGSASSIPKKSILKKSPSLVWPNMSTPLDCRHVQFEKEVTQMQTVDSEDDDEDGECALTMSPPEYRTDMPENQETAYDRTGHWTRQRSRSLSLPRAVPGPVGSSHNFLIDDNLDEVDELWLGENTLNVK